MADYTQLPIHALRAYLWAELKASGLYKENDYYVESLGATLVPIIPAQEIPEFNNLLPGKPFITYDYEVKPVLQNWWIQEEIAILNITSTDQDEINSVIMLLQDLFRRYDLSAAEINGYNPSSLFHFHYTAIEAVFSPEPFKSEGGHMQGVVHILYKFTRSTSSENGRF